jgi:hypothetical protein
MATQTMKVTSRQPIAGGGVKLLGTAIAPSTLTQVAGFEAAAPPPAATAASGNFAANAASVTFGSTIWTQVTTGNLKFTLTLTHTGGTVTDIDASNFGQP